MINMDGHSPYQSPPGVRQAAQRVLRWEEFDKEVEAQTGEDVDFVRGVLDGSHDFAEESQRLIAEKYAEWGRASAYIVDLVVRETPPQKPNWRSRLMSLGRCRDFEWPDRFAIAASSELIPMAPSATNESVLVMPGPDSDLVPRELATAAALVFQNARKTRLKESVIPFVGDTVKFDGIVKIPTGYSDLAWDMTPPRPRNPRLRSAYKEGFAVTVDELGLKGLTVAYAKEIMRRAPASFRALRIADGDKHVRMLTEYGLVIDLEKLSDGTTVRPPTTPKSVWERTRAQNAKPPSAGEIRRVHNEVVDQLRSTARQSSRYPKP